jgi:osmotically-inducible protein OsmY
MQDGHIHGEEKIGDPEFDVRAQDDPNLDDNSLRDRVESELFRFPEISKGEININVEGHVVVLRGQVEDQATIDMIVDLVRDIPDVRDVQSFLHVPGTVAPNKEESIEAS